MTNVYKTPEKIERKNRLFEIALEALETEGYEVDRIPGSGKSSVRRLTKDGKSLVASIRTTQDQCIAFPRIKDDSAWRTLDEVDVVVAVSVDDQYNPQFGWVHILDGDEMRDRFNRTYQARLDAGRQIKVGRGVWLPLYVEESDDNPNYVGAGAGLKYERIASIPLEPEDASPPPTPDSAGGSLTIPEAKRLLAISLGVDEAGIKITVEA